MKYTKDFHVSWEELHKDTAQLAKMLAAKGPWTGLVAIARGGLAPTAILAQLLNIRLVETICISCYDFQSQGEVEVLKKPQGIEDGKGWIMVDDLTDTGETFKQVRRMFPAAHNACLYAKPNGIETADTFVKEIPQETWVHFPWETGKS